MRPTRSKYLASSSHVGDGDQDGQEFPEHPDGDNHNAEEDEESPSVANEQKKEEKEDKTALLVRCSLAAQSPLPTIIKEMERCSSD